MTLHVLEAVLLLYLAAIALAIVSPWPRRVVLPLAALAGALATFAGISAIFGPSSGIILLPTGLPFGALTLALDPLSGFFLVIIGIIAIAVSLYAWDYLDCLQERWSLRLALVEMSLLFLSLVLIVAANDAISFLIAWETMALLSYLAVNYYYDDAAAVKAGYVMLAVSEIGTVGIVAALLFLGQAGGGYTFAALSHGGAALSLPLREVVFFCALFGFGAKAGLLPLQLWLPDANARAPSHVATVLSAAIEGLGIYGIVRFLVDFLGPEPAWLGLFTLVLGAITAFVGILHAFAERDLKRILAYSTIENDGIIVAAIGLSLTFRSFRLDILAAIAAIFALYQLLNHAIYKGLLFLGAGAVESATETRDLERLGGLIRRMPWTAVTFLIGALAIAAVAPFAGYISEWGILETALQSFAVPNTVAKLIIAGSGAMLALTAALAVTTFVRAYAIGFLALPRSEEAEAAHEVPVGMRAGMGFLAVICLALGALPAFVVTFLDRVSAPIWGTSVVNRVVPPVFTNHPGDYAALVGLGGGVFRGLPINGLIIIASPTFSTITSPTYLIICETLFLAILFGTTRLIRPLGIRRVGAVWAGGIPAFSPRMQYTAVAYANPARLIFNSVYRSRAAFSVVSAAARYGDGRAAYRQEIPPPLEEPLYRPIRNGIEQLAERIKVVQSGSVNQYVFYIFGMVLIVLVLRAV